MSERRSNPFGWMILGFIVGVLVTFGTILFLTSSGGGYEDGPAEVRTAADDAATAAMNASSNGAQSGPHKMETSAPVTVDPTAAAPRSTQPATPTQDLDPQVADDAAAAGMTSRTR